MKAKTITSITKGPRQSNMELLRIFAMFLILVVHADFWALGAPGMKDCVQSPFSSFTRFFIESIAILSVNIFILISGWFKIKPSVKGVANFVFQCLFFYILIYALAIVVGHAEFSVKGIKECILLTSKNWFIKSYIGIYILAPVLNCFIDNVSVKTLRNVVISFYVFQTLYGCSSAATFIENGYSTFSFIGLYLLASYCKMLNISNIKLSGGVFVAAVFINSIFSFTLTRCGFENSYAVVYTYINPLVVLGALGLTLYFTSIKISYNKFINWLGASSFAVFLVHCNPNIGTPLFKPMIQQIYRVTDGIWSILAIGFILILIFIFSVLIDQIRLFIWKHFINRLFVNK